MLEHMIYGIALQVIVGGTGRYMKDVIYVIIDSILSFIILFSLGWIEKFIFRDKIMFVVDEDNIFKISVIKR